MDSQQLRPQEKKGNAIEFGGRVVSWQKYLKTMDPAVPAPRTVKLFLIRVAPISTSSSSTEDGSSNNSSLEF